MGCRSLTRTEISAQVRPQRHSVTHKDLKALLVLFYEGFKLFQADLIVLVLIGLLEKLVCFELNFRNGRRGLSLHVLKGGERVRHQHCQLILADRLAAVEIIQVEDQVCLLVQCCVGHQRQTAHEFVRIDGAVTVHIKKFEYLK